MKKIINLSILRFVIVVTADSADTVVVVPKIVLITNSVHSILITKSIFVVVVVIIIIIRFVAIATDRNFIKLTHPIAVIKIDSDYTNFTYYY
jgi:hypothetical protein